MPKLPEDAKNLEELGELLPENRQRFLYLLSEKKWFRMTDFELQKELLNLPFDFDGYLEDLIRRREEYGGVVVLRLLKIPRGNYSITSMFEVRSNLNNQVFTYEYTSWKYGPNPGYRGIIFLEIEGKIKYFVLRRTEKFAVANEVLETIGSWIQVKEGKLLNIPKTIEEQFKNELGLEEVKVDRFVDLGRINADPAMVNSSTSLYAAIIKIDNAGAIERLEKKIFHTKPISYQLVIEPIEKLKEYVENNNESFFLACVLRLVSMGIVKI